jgi:hypothetical protein
MQPPVTGGSFLFIGEQSYNLFLYKYVVNKEKTK